MAPDDEQYTRDDLVTQLQQLAEELGRSPTVADLRDATDYPSEYPFLNVFETWNQAKQAAGLDTHRKEGRKDPYTEAELLDLLRRLAHTIDGRVTIQAANDSEICPSAVTYKRRFGSWNQAKEAAGLATLDADETPSEYTDAELCDFLRDLAATVDRPLKIEDLEAADNYPGHATFKRRFGSWNAAKRAAGLDIIEKGKSGRSNSYTNDELLELLRQRAEDVDGSLTKEAMNRATDCPSASTYERRFGSWQTAKEKALQDG